MGFLLLVYFSIPVGCELGSQSCKPGSLPKIPLFTGIPVGYGGISVRYGLGSRLDVYWDPGGIWWDMDWDPGWMCTGIPVGCVLGSQWDMVGYGLGSQWMWTGIPTKYPSGIEGGIPVGSQWGSQFYFHWGYACQTWFAYSQLSLILILIYFLLGVWNVLTCILVMKLFY